MITTRARGRLSKAWLVAVDMGYGHERAAYGLRDLAYGGKAILANNYPGIPARDRRLWLNSQSFYQKVSKWKSLPIVGNFVFDVYDNLQAISPFYPRRDLSRPTVQLRELYHLIRSKNLGRDLIDRLRKKNLPLVTTFFLPAFAAEVFGYPGEIYCVVCDADVSRTWAPLDPKKSNIKYFAPNGRVVERLKLYGVPERNIFLTGFPIPKDLVDGLDGTMIKRDLARRLTNLDPNGIFRTKYDHSLHHFFGKSSRSIPSKYPTITFSVGGVGAQHRLGEEILESLRVKIARGEIGLNLVAGTHDEVKQSYLRAIKSLKMQRFLGKNLAVVNYESRAEYFRAFTKLLRTTDILWTKPSELSFYAGAGLPIIMAPPIGSQEEFNALWLREVGAGIPQADPKYTNEWLTDWHQSGGLARAAWSGYVEAPTHGSYRIQSVITDEKFPLEKLPLIV